MNVPSTNKETQSFASYLINKSAKPESIAIYERAVLDINMSKRDQKILRFMLAHPYTIGMIDGALALLEPQSPIRQRLYILFSILEATPENHQLFLPVKRSAWYIFVVGYHGILAVLQTIFGIGIVKVILK